MAAPTRNLETIRDWHRYAVSRLHAAGAVLGQGTTTLVDEAAWLVGAAVDLPPEHFASFLDARVTAPEAKRLRQWIERRVDGRVPVAYLTGEAWLGGLPFAVDERVLVPRSYFVEVLPDRLGPWLPEPAKVRRVLELCTGSGCLAVILAHAYPESTVDATDLSTDALAVAAENVVRHGLEDRVTLLDGDLWDALPPDAGPYDLILSNPPYEPSALCDALPPEFVHEPRLALDGGPDGLDLVRRIVHGARARLAPDGLLALEVGGLRDALEAAFPDVEWTWLQTEDGATAIVVAPAASLPAGPVAPPAPPKPKSRRRAKAAPAPAPAASKARRSPRRPKNA